MNTPDYPVTALPHGIEGRPRPVGRTATAITGAEAEHPNELDVRRILRALAARSRYRYVTPRVEPVAGGYLIVAPCCSRNIDAEGGPIEIALLRPCPDAGTWRVLAKDHKLGQWHEEAECARLSEALALINRDPDRRFWQ